MTLVHYFAPGAGLAYCSSDVRHNGERYSTYEGDATCFDCLSELAESGRWPGARDVLDAGLYERKPVDENNPLAGLINAFDAERQRIERSR